MNCWRVYSENPSSLTSPRSNPSQAVSILSQQYTYTVRSALLRRLCTVRTRENLSCAIRPRESYHPSKAQFCETLKLDPFRVVDPQRSSKILSISLPLLKVLSPFVRSLVHSCEGDQMKIGKTIYP